jgi:hypothetical protein
MSDPKSHQFDCVQAVREARDRISAEIEHMSPDQLLSWLRSHRYSDPVLRRLAEKAVQQAASATGASHRH